MNTILGFPITEIFDTVQTHAACNVPQRRVDEVKQALKERGATRFRVVKTRAIGGAIVCFKLKKDAV